MFKIGEEIKFLIRALKVTEKESYNLENKTLNQQDLIKKIKEENSNLKGEKIKKDKEIKKLMKNFQKDKNQNHLAKTPKVDVSTNTEFSPQMSSSASTSTTICKGLEQ